MPMRVLIVLWLDCLFSTVCEGGHSLMEIHGKLTPMWRFVECKVNFRNNVETPKNFIIFILLLSKSVTGKN